MIVRRYLGLIGLVFCLSGPSLLRADILLNSLAGLSGLCLYDGTASTYPNTSTATTCVAQSTTTVAIGVHPAWQPNHPVNPGASDNSAVWISYQPSGFGDVGGFVPYKGTTPVFALEQTFAATSGQTLKLHVWADDTAGVYLDNIQLKAPMFTQSTCSGQPIGCRSQDLGTFNEVLNQGTHTLRFDVFQVGTGTTTSTNPIGLLYTGAVVPDGGVTLMLLGGALVGLETLRRKLRA